MPGKTTQQLLEEMFSELQEREDYPAGDVRQRVAFISTPRCGSSMFCDTINRTGLMGESREWLNRRYMEAWGQCTGQQNVKLNEYLDFVFRKTSSNGIYAVNFHVDQYRDMQGLGFNPMSLGFTHVYYLYRREKIDQAWSLARAKATDQWSSDAEAVRDAGALEWGDVLKCLLSLYNDEQFYRENLAQATRKEFAYEDFSVPGHVDSYKQVLSDLGVEAGSVDFSTGMEKQRAGNGNDELRQFKQYLSPSTKWG